MQSPAKAGMNQGKRQAIRLAFVDAWLNRRRNGERGQLAPQDRSPYCVLVDARPSATPRKGGKNGHKKFEARGSQKEKARRNAGFSGLLHLMRVTGIEPARLAAPDPKSGMSTNFTISAKCECKYNHNFLLSK